MPPRKSQSPATQAKDESKRKQPKLEGYPLTADEKTFLAHVLSVAAGPLSSPTGKQKGASAARHTLQDEEWWIETAVPRLATITEKVLKIAAQQYHTNHRDYTGPSGSGGAGGAGGDAAAASSSTIAGPGATVTPSGAAAAAAASNAPPPPPAGSPAQFAEENAYLVEQLRQLPQCPFTIERLAEVLSDPSIFLTAKDGRMNPEALQAALRRCILVTYPVAVSLDDKDGDE